MALEFNLVGDTGKGSANQRQVDVHPFETATGKHSGLVVLSHPLIGTEPSTKFFINTDFGINMNQDVAFSGTPDRIHNGTDSTLWTATSIAGAKFTFNSTDRANEGVITMVDYSALEGGETITVNAQVITEGVDWDAETSNSVTATNIATALNAVATIGITAQAFSGIVSVSIDGGDNIDMSTNADSGEITIAAEKSIKTDNAAVNDTIQFANSGDITMSNYTALNMKINVDKDWKDGDSIEIYGYDTDLNVVVGNRIKLEDFFTFGDFDTWQNLVIPLSIMGLSSSTTVDAFRVEIISKEGKSPKFYLDRIQLEQSGTPSIFSLNVDKGDRFHISELTFRYADVLDITNANGTAPGLSHDAILGVSELPIGILITRHKAGKTLFSALIKTLGDHMAAGAKADQPWSDSDNKTHVILRAEFEDPLVITGDPNDMLTIQINDNLSGLTKFTCSARGSLENTELIN